MIHDEINKIKKSLLQNKYPLDFLNYLINKFVKKCVVKKVAETDKQETSPKDEFTIVLPFLGNQSNIIRKKLNKMFSDLLPTAKLKIILKSGIKIGSLFNFKDPIPSNIRSLVVYKFKCGSCNATYIGKTERHHKIRMCEHLGISYRTGEPTKFNKNTTTSIRDHILETGHQNTFENFESLSFGNNNLECLIKEKILIQKCSPPLINKQVENFKLSLF